MSAQFSRANGRDSNSSGFDFHDRKSRDIEFGTTGVCEARAKLLKSSCLYGGIFSNGEAWLIKAQNSADLRPKGAGFNAVSPVFCP
jgi:hypothetical protein